jgi:hypothetical protein
MFIIEVSPKVRNLCTSCKERSLEWVLLPIAFQISLLHLGAQAKITFSDLRYCLPILDIAFLSNLIVNVALTALATQKLS